MRVFGDFGQNRMKGGSIFVEKVARKLILAQSDVGVQNRFPGHQSETIAKLLTLGYLLY